PPTPWLPSRRSTAVSWPTRATWTAFSRTVLPGQAVWPTAWWQRSTARWACCSWTADFLEKSIVLFSSASRLFERGALLFWHMLWFHIVYKDDSWYNSTKL